MKKFLAFFTLMFTLVLGTEAAFAAEAGKIDSLTAEGTKTSVEIEGTVDTDNIYAVVIQIRDKSGEIIVMKSAGVTEKSFEAAFTGLNLTAGSTYDIYAANYVGGAWTKAEVTIPKDAAPTPEPTPEPVIIINPAPQTTSDDKQTEEDNKTEENNQNVVNNQTGENSEESQKTEEQNSTENITETTDADGNKTIASTTVEKDGTIVKSEICKKTDGSSEETITIDKEGSKNSVKIELEKNAEGIITASKAVVTRKVPSGSTGLKLPGSILDRIAEEMNGKKIWITFVAKDEEGNTLYKVKVSSKAIAMDVPLYLERYDSETRSYVQYSSKAVKPGETGNYHATKLSKGTFRLVTKGTFDKAAKAED